MTFVEVHSIWAALPNAPFEVSLSRRRPSEVVGSVTMKVWVFVYSLTVSQSKLQREPAGASSTIEAPVTAVSPAGRTTRHMMALFSSPSSESLRFSQPSFW